MAHIARLHHYLQGLMRHLQSQIQSMNVVVAEEEARSLNKKNTNGIGGRLFHNLPRGWTAPKPLHLDMLTLLQTTLQKPLICMGHVLLLLIDLLARSPGHQLILHSLFFCTEQRWNTAVYASIYTAPLHLLAEFTLSSLSLLFTMLINPQIFHNSFFHFCPVVSGFFFHILLKWWVMFYSICSGTRRPAKMFREPQLLCTRACRHHTKSRDSIVWEDQEKGQGTDSRKCCLSYKGRGWGSSEGKRTGLWEWIGEEIESMKK